MRYKRLRPNDMQRPCRVAEQLRSHRDARKFPNGSFRKLRHGSEYRKTLLWIRLRIYAGRVQGYNLLRQNSMQVPCGGEEHLRSLVNVRMAAYGLWRQLHLSEHFLPVQVHAHLELQHSDGTSGQEHQESAHRTSAAVLLKDESIMGSSFGMEPH